MNLHKKKQASIINSSREIMFLYYILPDIQIAGQTIEIGDAHWSEESLKIYRIDEKICKNFNLN